MLLFLKRRFLKKSESNDHLTLSQTIFHGLLLLASTRKIYAVNTNLCKKVAEHLHLLKQVNLKALRLTEFIFVIKT